jgi:hypothetical protein
VLIEHVGTEQLAVLGVGDTLTFEVTDETKTQPPKNPGFEYYKDHWGHMLDYVKAQQQAKVLAAEANKPEKPRIVVPNRHTHRGH